MAPTKPITREDYTRARTRAVLDKYKAQPPQPPRLSFDEPPDSVDVDEDSVDMDDEPESYDFSELAPESCSCGGRR